MKNEFAFIGAGNMGGALVEAVCRARGGESVIIFDHSEEKQLALSEKTGCTAADSVEAAVSAAKFVFMCVKPKVLPEVLRSLSGCFKSALERGEKKVLVSIAAGVSISSIEAMLNEEKIQMPVIRLMPNTPVAVGRGLVLVMPSGSVSERDAAELMDALSEAGESELFDERIVDAATPVFSCSPAFGYMFVEALADGGVMAGVPREQAQRFAAQALLGAAAMVLETGKHPGRLKDEVCSPGGSTIVGVETLEKASFRAAVAEAVYRAYEKTVKLGE